MQADKKDHVFEVIMRVKARYKITEEDKQMLDRNSKGGFYSLMCKNTLEAMDVKKRGKRKR